jgi:hypothetical protein
VADVKKLTRIDFDTMENHSPEVHTEVGIFTPGDGLTAYGKISRWFQEQEPVKLYTGYDGQVYPQWKIEPVKVI